MQHDPSNATVGGFDPVAFLEKVKHRVVSMHASDRYPRRAPRSRICARRRAPPGYPAKLLHGETGCGLNDYDAIFRILAGVGFAGWISIEDGVNGLDEMARSVAFLEAEARRILRRLTRRDGRAGRTCAGAP